MSYCKDSERRKVEEELLSAATRLHDSSQMEGSAVWLIGFKTEHSTENTWRVSKLIDVLPGNPCNLGGFGGLGR